MEMKWNVRKTQTSPTVYTFMHSKMSQCIKLGLFVTCGVTLVFLRPLCVQCGDFWLPIQTELKSQGVSVALERDMSRTCETNVVISPPESVVPSCAVRHWVNTAWALLWVDTFLPPFRCIHLLSLSNLWREASWWSCLAQRGVRDG